MREPTHPTEVITGRARVLDGDTIEVNGSVRVRFFGVDAPEYDQKILMNGQELPCGQIAKQALKDLIAEQPVRCEVYDVDHYGRKCAVVFNSANEDLNASLCRQGYVMAFTKVTRRYVGLEAEAKAAKRGIWGGQMQDPSEYRRQKRQQQAGGGQGGRPPHQQQQQTYNQQQPHRPPPHQQQQTHHQQQPHGPPAPQGVHAPQGSGGHAQPDGGAPHWLVKLLEAVLGACLGRK